MFEPTRVGAALPAQDIDRAKSFDADRLGLKPSEEMSDGLRYDVGNNSFLLFPSFGKASGDHTQLAFEVEDFDDAMKTLRDNGVVFEEYDLPGFKSVDGVVEFEGTKGAWFKDTEGNLLAIGPKM